MHIRHAIESDLPAIVEIFNASIPGRLATAVIEPVTIEQRRDWFDAHSADHYPLWVCELEGTIVGWISLTPFFPERPAYSHTVELSVYVGPSAQGQGIGGILVDYALQAAPQLGIRSVVSLVFAHNEVSLRLHHRLGFERWGLMPGVAELDAIPRDVVILGRRIGGPVHPAS